jgi:hypothetical protein
MINAFLGMGVYDKEPVHSIREPTREDACQI